MYRIVLCLVLCLSVFAQKDVSKGCESDVGSFMNVTVTNCKPQIEECILKRRTNATITITFDINKDISKVKAEVFGLIGGAPIPFQIGQPNGCIDSGLTCPLEKGKGPFQYTATLDIQQWYPRIRVKVKWELMDENNKKIVCVLIPSAIK